MSIERPGELKQELIVGNIPERLWGFRQPTVLVESQSAPALIGDPAEQAYIRAFVLASSSDMVITDFPLNSTYLHEYLEGILGLDLPEFNVTKTNGARCLSENIMSDGAIKEKTKGWASGKQGVARIQFFNVTPYEKALQAQLGIEATCGNVDLTIAFGSKPGFRRLCEGLGLPMPEGYICSNLDLTVQVAEKFMRSGRKALIKSQHGTGGTDLKSNVMISEKDFMETGMERIEDYVLSKMEELGRVLGEEWVVEEEVVGEDGSVHVYIHDANNADEPFILGALSENNSYVGGYWPFVANGRFVQMATMVRDVMVPHLQKMRVYGYHCFDFKGPHFLEDNARQGALDFIDGIVNRISRIHFPRVPYAFWHNHVSIPQPLSFERTFLLLKDFMDPQKSDGNFLVITNPEVLPYGRSLDLTAVSFGNESSVDKARRYFEDVRVWLNHII